VTQDFPNWAVALNDGERALLEYRESNWDDADPAECSPTKKSGARPALDYGTART
jgi:hypothetical protein